MPSSTIGKSGNQMDNPSMQCFFFDDQQTFERLIKLPDGILLITGPTGS